ncbi:MAG: ATP-binding protein [bacterium]|nr:ATP-binding protein [bacterium]
MSKSSSLATVNNTSEARQFGVHPAIILTLIKEQAGSSSKALCELIMNSVDAGATRIDVLINEVGFSIADNGKGFSSREEIETFFEIFGTPHKKDDAYFGKFRIGRGQIMSFAKTDWRSGFFGMHVDIHRRGDLGYELTTFKDAAPGCVIKGEFYDQHDFSGFDEECDYGNSIKAMVKFVSVPVFVNGMQINTPPLEIEWSVEDENAWYKFDSDQCNLKVYNRGAFVTYYPGSTFGLTGTIVTKHPLTVNMARNEILRRECHVWKCILATLQTQFNNRILSAKKLDSNECYLLMKMILGSRERFNHNICKNIETVRFIPNIFGENRSPKDLFINNIYTLYNGRHSMVAERVQQLGRANVIMPEFMRTCGLESNEDNFEHVITSLFRALSGTNASPTFVLFSDLVHEMDGLNTLVKESELTAEEKLVLVGLNRYNRDMSVLFERKKRRIIIGVSNQMNAWTDGHSYIAINRKELRGIRESGPHVLVALMAHEYCHDESSIESHPHDRNFYARFHSCILKYQFGFIVNGMMRHYLSGLAKIAIVPSKEVGYHAKQIAKIALKLPTRVQEKNARQ